MKDNSNRAKATNITDAIVALVVKNKLLHQENEGLREAFKNKKKRRQRGKALILLPPEDWHGGAIFYSPSKVQQALLNQK